MKKGKNRTRKQKQHNNGPHQDQIFDNRSALFLALMIAYTALSALEQTHCARM